MAGERPRPGKRAGSLTVPTSSAVLSDSPLRGKIGTERPGTVGTNPGQTLRACLSLNYKTAGTAGTDPGQESPGQTRDKARSEDLQLLLRPSPLSPTGFPSYSSPFWPRPS